MHVLFGRTNPIVPLESTSCHSAAAAGEPRTGQYPNSGASLANTSSNASQYPPDRRAKSSSRSSRRSHIERRFGDPLRCRGLRQRDLIPVFGSSSVASDVLNGKRGISKAHVRKLAEFFHVPASLFV